MKNRIKKVLVYFCMIFFALSFISEVFSVPPPKPYRYRKPPLVKRRFIPAPLPKRPLRPGLKYIWVPRYRHPSGVYIGGFWRPPCREKFLWVKGYWNEAGEWIFGYCKPVVIREGYAWVPGYWDGTALIEGYWRPVKKPGFVWIPGHFNDNGIWIKGHWKNQ